jgi:hypothetical protein
MYSGDWIALPRRFPSSVPLLQLDHDRPGWARPTTCLSWCRTNDIPFDSLARLLIVDIGYDPWSRRFSIVPVCTPGHVWLVIFDTRGFLPTQDNALDPEKTPFLYVLDSMNGSQRLPVARRLSKWITYWQIIMYKINLPLPPRIFVPKVARQQDGCNCAMFAAYFIIVFCSAPERFARAFQVCSP